MKRNKKILAVASSLVVGLLAVFSYLMWWPTPACSNKEFNIAMQVMSDLLVIPIVSGLTTPLHDQNLPQLRTFRRRLHELVNPPRRCVGTGYADPIIVKYNFQSTNEQVQVTSIVSQDKIVCVKVVSFGKANLSEAIKTVLSNWVPTSKIQIEYCVVDTPLWKQEKSNSDFGGFPPSPDRDKREEMVHQQAITIQNETDDLETSILKEIEGLSSTGSLLNIKRIVIHSHAFMNDKKVQKQIFDELERMCPKILAEAKSSAGNMHNPKVCALQNYFDRALLETPFVKNINVRLSTSNLRIAKEYTDKFWMENKDNDHLIGCAPCMSIERVK
jgi:hypothetical protein